MSSFLNMLLRLELCPTNKLLCSSAWSWSAQATIVIQDCYVLCHSYSHLSLAPSYFFWQCLWHCRKITFYIFHNFWLATVCPSGEGFSFVLLLLLVLSVFSGRCRGIRLSVIFVVNKTVINLVNLVVRSGQIDIVLLAMSMAWQTLNSDSHRMISVMNIASSLSRWSLNFMIHVTMADCRTFASISENYDQPKSLLEFSISVRLVITGLIETVVIYVPDFYGKTKRLGHYLSCTQWGKEAGVAIHF